MMGSHIISIRSQSMVEDVECIKFKIRYKEIHNEYNNGNLTE